jgi:hypothetical protein
MRFQGKRISFRSFLLILALIAVSRGLNSWRSGLKAASRGIPLAAALQTLPPGRSYLWSAVASEARHRFEARDYGSRKRKRD